MGCGNSKDVTSHQNKSKSSNNGTISEKANEEKRKNIINKTPRKIEKKDQQQKSEKEGLYKQIDKHARKAPKSLKNSADDLVNYLSSVSKEPRLLVRGFFVWISENIKYDVEGYFGRAKSAPYDSEGVMKCGRSVCGGYANVMEELCRKASIPVKNISGFAKGFGHSADQVIIESSETNHAWNALQLEGKWYLIDNTWGAGHLDQSSKFEKKINEFYFLANPKHIITTHFPYMNRDMAESMKWQLLGTPVNLLEFSRGIEYGFSAFQLGARAVSHTNGLVEMKNELKMVFESEGPDEIAFSASLMLREGQWLRGQRNATYGYLENGVFMLLVHPPKVGTFTMDVFGHPVSEEKLSGIPQLMSYLIKCTEVNDKEFEYPYTFATHDEENVILREPMTGKLPANTKVNFKIEAPYLQTIRAGKTLFEKSGKTFTGLVETGAPGHLSVYGNRAGPYDHMSGLLQFTVI